MGTRAVYRAREQFLSRGDIGHDLEAAVGADVLRSWRRSKLSGAKPEVTGLPLILEQPPETALTLAAEPVLARLAEQFAGFSAGVLLSDRNANVLRRWAPDLPCLERMDRTCSAAGASGAEAIVGTNGIGTVTEERRPRMVVGPQHFADIFLDHACIGAPIHHPLSRRFEGVVTLSTSAEVASPLLLPLVMGTAREIEQRLLEQSSRKERRLLDAFLAASRRGSAAAVIGEGVFMMGPRASRLLRGVDPSTLWLRVRDELPAIERNVTIRLSTAERSMRLICEPLSLDGHLVGALLDVCSEEPPVVGPRRATLLAVGGASLPLAAAPASPARLRSLPTGWPEARRELPGRSALWSEVLAAAAAQVTQPETLMLLGEPGCGKLSLLRLIHTAAGQADERWRIVECGVAEPAHEALRREVDTLDERGTIVLHHLDGLDDPAASALLAALDGVLSRPGVRVAATLASVDAHEASAQYRRLFDMLSVNRIEVPPLRQRSEDIPELVAHLTAKHGARPLRFASKASVALERAPWPGNVRQLETVVRGLIASAAGSEITVEMLPPEVGAFSRRRPLAAIEQLEFAAILSALRRTKGNKVLTAQLLGMSRSTLYRKLASYQLDPDNSFF